MCTFAALKKQIVIAYAIKEIYYTLQGEGHYTGRPAVFVRFSGCNLWSGLEKDRKTAICQFCDTNFWGTDGKNGGKYKLEDLVNLIDSLWPANQNNKYVVCTGGEPALQIDDKLVNSLHHNGFEIGIETNGSLALPKDIDWVCVSPKAGSALKVISGNELKVVIPQENQDLTSFKNLDFDHFYVQAMDGPLLRDNLNLAIDYCKNNPQWKLSVQTHKYLGID